MGGLRKPFFVVAVVAIAVVVLIELGSALVLGGGPVGAGLAGQAAGLGVEVPDASEVEETPGRGIPYLALIDVILLYTIALMVTSLLAPDRLLGRAQGVTTLVGSIVLIILAVVLLVIAIAELILMLTLLFAPPLGTVAYLARFGFFPRGDAAILLSVLMLLKLVFPAALVLAHKRFLQNKGLVLLIVTSLVANVIVAFLHGLVPLFLVSITDDVAAIVLAVIAIVWAVALLIGSIPAVVKAVKAPA